MHGLKFTRRHRVPSAGCEVQLRGQVRSQMEFGNEKRKQKWLIRLLRSFDLKGCGHADISISCEMTWEVFRQRLNLYSSTTINGCWLPTGTGHGKTTNVREDGPFRHLRVRWTGRTPIARRIHNSVRESYQPYSLEKFARGTILLEAVLLFTERSQ